MTKLSITDIAHIAFSGSGIGEKNTISNGPDNGANNCQARHWWNVMRHDSTARAIDNVLTAPFVNFVPPPPVVELDNGATGSGAANIIGHGNEGVIETGMGQSGPFDNNKIIFPWNISYWGPELDRIQASRITYVSLWACHPGAGDDGAELVYLAATRAQRAVRAPTGFLFCNSKQIWFEKGTQWQVGTPTHRPTPIPAPSQHFTAQTMWQFESSGRALTSKDVSSVAITPAGFGPMRIKSTSVQGQDAQDLVDRIFRSPPIDLSGVGVTAFATANVAITFADGTGADFTIYNDRLAIENRSGTAYYTTSLGLLGL